MAASDHIQGIYDVALKPRLLRFLLKEYVPDEKHPLRNPSDLSHVVSAVKTHQLLSECAPHSTDQKVLDSWKSAVDTWVNRVLTLASVNSPDKIWAGICLLGLTCQECSSERFFASYADWFNKIFSYIQAPSDSHFVRVASSASMSDLFTRLGGFPNAKKDGTSLATKLVQSVVKLLNEDGSDVVWEEAVHLLCVIVNVFPSAVGRHYDNIEAAFVSKIMSENCNNSTLKKLGHGLASLPKSRGDEDSWSLMMQKILLFLNNSLNDAFQGLEDEARSNQVMKLLLPPGKEPPPPLGGSTVLGKISNQAIKRPEEVLISRISTLLLCCGTMLNNSYPIQVAVPVRPIVALVRRVLMVDGSLSQAYPFMTVMRQEFICSELPVLHGHSLELLSATVKGLRSQLLPHVADITRLLTQYFRTCGLAELRIKVYSIVKVLLMSMGVGIAIYLIQEIINNAFIDLDSRGHESKTDSAAYFKASEEALELPLRRKRKHPTTTGSLVDQSDQGGLEVKRPQSMTPIALKIAALEALEALLTVGGALRSDSWRYGVDHLLITVATNACRGGWAREQNTALYGNANPTWADFQLAALRSLLASLLAPGRLRPPHLAQGLNLFQRGTRETGTKIAEYCSHALLTLEVLIHPRALSIIDFQSSGDHHDGMGIKIPENKHSTVTGQNTIFHVGTVGRGPSEAESVDDDLSESWLRNGDEMEIPTADIGKNNSNGEEAPGISRHPSFEKVTSSDFAFRTNDREEHKTGASEGRASDIILVDKDEMMVELRTQVTSKQPVDHDHTKGGNLDSVVGDLTPAQSVGDLTDLVVASTKEVTTAESDAMTAVVEKITASTSGDDKPPTTQEDGYDQVVEKISATISNSQRSKGIVDEMHDESSDDDSLPDIIDGDPDSN